LDRNSPLPEAARPVPLLSSPEGVDHGPHFRQRAHEPTQSAGQDGQSGGEQEVRGGETIHGSKEWKAGHTQFSGAFSGHNSPRCCTNPGPSCILRAVKRFVLSLCFLSSLQLPQTPTTAFADRGGVSGGGGENPGHSGILGKTDTETFIDCNGVIKAISNKDLNSRFSFSLIPQLCERARRVSESELAP
jgi:hypothetical protein